MNDDQNQASSSEEKLTLVQQESTESEDPSDAQRKKERSKAYRKYRQEEELKPFQAELLKVQQYLEEKQRRMIILFEGRDAAKAIGEVKDLPDCVMVNRNQGSGTRILIDRLLQGAQPAGYAVQSKSHNAVAAAIARSSRRGSARSQAIAGTSGVPLSEQVPGEAEQADDPGDEHDVARTTAEKVGVAHLGHHRRARLRRQVLHEHVGDALRQEVQQAGTDEQAGHERSDRRRRRPQPDFGAPAGRSARAAVDARRHLRHPARGFRPSRGRRRGGGHDRPEAGRLFRPQLQHQQQHTTITVSDKVL